MNYEDQVFPLPSALKGRRARRYWRYYAGDVARKRGLCPATTLLLVAFCNRLAEFAGDIENADIAEFEKLRRAIKPLGITI
jgi:hypothetical protein